MFVKREREKKKEDYFKSLSWGKGEKEYCRKRN